ncbi:sugar phosphate isomerase/epimerase family protein [Alicyclobacillus hesperidum]|uniref:sugar phosphate isomerase/epimerase family protein n=1 Tax=Alicyclobacillus hesperidum TaxID=89784 RepID=UPI0024914C67|nr:sugar phosphate isomerase/epimerase [Alicyclobacillus hesperidum]
MDVLEDEAISHIEFRGVWNKNVLDLSNAELESVRNQLRARGIRVSAVGSPIGKISVHDDFGEHLQKFERAIAIADTFDTPFIRIFSFFIPDDSSADEHRTEVLWRIGELVRRAEEAGVVLLHENEKGIYGESPARCLDLFATCSSTSLQAVFDPANFVQCGVKPFHEALPLLQSHVAYVHIKDALFEGKRVVPAGEGDGEVRDVLAALFQRGYNGFLSLEPHLALSSAFCGFSGPDLFRIAARSLKSILEELGQPWC